MKTALSAPSRSMSVQILLFSLPLIVSNLLQVLFNMADIAVVGRFSGPLSLAAVGSTSIAVSLFTGVLIGISGGVNALVARYFGARDFDGMRKSIHSSCIVCLLCGLVIALFGVYGSRPLLALLSTKPELLEKATLYMQVYLTGMPALALFNFGNAVYSAIGNTRKPLIFLLLAGILNVVLNLFFVIVCHLDVAGVAFASIISQYASAAAVLVSLFREQNVYGLSWNALRPSGFYVREILWLGLPGGMQNALFYIASLFVQAGVNSFDTMMVAGNTAATNADPLVYDVMAAFYTACASYIGMNYGAGNFRQIKKCYLICLAYSCGVGALLGFGLVAVGPTFLSFFTTDPAVVEAGMHRLTIMGLSYWVSGLMDNAIAGCRGLGKSIIPTVIVVSGSCIFRIIWIYTIFAWYHTIESLYLLYLVSWAITAFFENWYLIRCYKKAASLA